EQLHASIRVAFRAHSGPACGSGAAARVERTSSETSAKIENERTGGRCDFVVFMASLRSALLGRILRRPNTRARERGHVSICAERVPSDSWYDRIPCRREVPRIRATPDPPGRGEVLL